LQELREQKQELREQKQELKALREQMQPSLPHQPEEVAADLTPPVPPPIVNHLGRVLGPVVRPVGRGLRQGGRLLWQPVRWGVVQPLNYLVFAPLGYGLRCLDPSEQILGFTERIEQKRWEKRLDNLSAALEELGVVKLIAGGLLMLGYVVFLLDMGERDKERQYQAWGVVNTGASVQPEYDYVFEDSETGKVVYVGQSIEKARLAKEVTQRSQLKTDSAGEPMQRVRLSSTGEGGRIKAIQDLYRDNQSLAGLQAPGAYLPKINLGGWCWDFIPDRFNVSCSKRVNLYGANLEGADLESANLKGASLRFANLEGAVLRSANLEGAVLSVANLEGAVLSVANLEGADLEDAKLEDTILLAANLHNTKHLVADQLVSSYLCATDLPPDLKLNPDRDCEKLPTLLVERYPGLGTIEEVRQRINGIRQQKANQRNHQ
jgi:hypothetical protein